MQKVSDKVTSPAGNRTSANTDNADELTVASFWEGATGTLLSEDLLLWPPDVLAFTSLVLGRTEVHRFVLSPPLNGTWPPTRVDNWSDMVQQAAREWSAWVEEPAMELHKLVASEWETAVNYAETPLASLAAGEPWRACEALLTLHAVADEACAGLFVASDRGDGHGALYRAQGRELLAQKGTLSRIQVGRVRIVPRIRTPVNGEAPWTRYAAVLTPGLETRWHKIPTRRPGIGPAAESLNVLLLPWPLRVRASDFRTIGPVQRPAGEPYGFFEFSPAEPLDLSLVEDALLAAFDEVGSVAAVVFPECAIRPDDIGALEAVLAPHGVACLVAGVREAPLQPGRFGRNWVHIGQQLVRGGGLAGDQGGDWFRLRQDKHHRWYLDERQIDQYQLGSTLHPQVRWWEAMETPQSSLQLMQVGEEITFAMLVCEDLAHNDAVAEAIRAVGPTMVMALLLDGPQVKARWTARYASVLADNPGSSVFTLSSAGMVARSNRAGGTVIGLWKDPGSRTREITLEPGAQGVVLSVCGTPATRRCADGRPPATAGTRYFDTAVYQVRAAPRRATPNPKPENSSAPRKPSVLDVDELSVLTGWAEGAAEALAHAPEKVSQLLAAARAGAAWRGPFGLAQPSERLARALQAVEQLVTNNSDGQLPSYTNSLSASQAHQPGEQPLNGIARQVLRSALEQRHTQPIHIRAGVSHVDTDPLPVPNSNLMESHKEEKV